MTVLGWLGLLLICWAIWRMTIWGIDDITRAAHVRRVMEGREPAPWEPEPYGVAEYQDWQRDQTIVTYIGIWDDVEGRHV